jgi:ComF family protein
MTVAWRALRGIAAGFIDLLLPGACAGCDRAATDATGLCDKCGIRRLQLVALPYCRRCGATLRQNVPAYPDGCVECPNPLPRFSRVFRLGPYAPPLRNIVHDLKYHARTGIAGRTMDLLAERIAEDARDAPFDVIAPTPMHWARRLGRGVDHARLLAEMLGKGLAVPVGTELVRVRNTPPQVHLTRTQRIANVRGAFAVAHRPAIAGARVLLVDDVTTTCATASEAARTLLRAGALDVALAVIAKAEPPRAYTQHWT